MMICPQCDAEIAAAAAIACSACGWRGERRDGVEVWLGARDYSDPTLREYFANYDSIAKDDLREGVLDDRYVLNQAKNLADFLGDVGNLDVCDVGCGQGVLARELLSRNPASLTVVDISHAYLSRLTGTAEIRTVLANAENLPFKEAFDVIVSTDVMEHVLNLGSFLFAINRALRKGGRAAIRVPLRENLLSYSPHLGCPYRFVHLRTFNRANLRDALEQAGFRTESTRCDGYIVGRPQPFWQQSQRRVDVYSKFQSFVERRLASPTDVTRWPPWLAQIFMPPLEIVAIARKTAAIESTPNGGFRLV